MSIVKNFQNRSRTTNYHQQWKDFTRFSTVHQYYQYISISADCGQRRTHNHCQICPSKGRIGTNAESLANSLKSVGNPTNNNKSQLQQANINQIDTTTIECDDEELHNQLRELYEQAYDSKYDSDPSTRSQLFLLLWQINLNRSMPKINLKISRNLNDWLW